jgi:hypothetical protein
MVSTSELAVAPEASAKMLQGPMPTMPFRLRREGGGNAGCFSGYCQKKEIAFGVWDMLLVGEGILVAALVGCPLAAWLGCPLAVIGLRAAGAVGLVAKRVVACCGGGCSVAPR